MKKNKFLCVVLTLAVAFTMMFAGTGAAFASTAYAADDSVIESNIIEAVDINSSDIIPDLAVMTYTSTPDSVQIKTAKAGTIGIRVTATDASYASLYDAEGNQIYGYGTSIEASTSNTDYKYAYFPVSAAGTYKLEMTSYASSQVGAYVDAFYYPKGGTPTKGTEYYGSSPDGKVAYYKITATGNGYISVDIPHGYNDPATYQVKLFNSSKKAVFKKGYESVGQSKDYKTRIGVTKGTYYIGVKTSDPYYGITLKFTKVAEKSGSTKAKAVKLTKGATKKGIITASQSSTSGDWYKFTLSKAQKVNLDVTTLTSQGGDYGGLKISIYSGKTSYPFGTATFNYNSANDTLNPYTSGYSGKLQAGTYYIKVQKYNDGNGYYKIKWQ